MLDARTTPLYVFLLIALATAALVARRAGLPLVDGARLTVTLAVAFVATMFLLGWQMLADSTQHD